MIPTLSRRDFLQVTGAGAFASWGLPLTHTVAGAAPADQAPFVASDVASGRFDRTFWEVMCVDHGRLLRNAVACGSRR